MKLFLSILTTSLFIYGCSNSKDISKNKESQIQEIWIQSHRPDPRPNHYLVQYGAEQKSLEWDSTEMRIEGFKYVPGSLYHLKIKELDTSDDPIKSYQLIEVVDQILDKKLLITDIYALINMGETRSSPELNLSRTYIEVNASNRTIMGHAICNDFRGHIKELSETVIQFDQIVMTRKGCEYQSVEVEFSSRLNQVTGYSREGLHLVFTNQHGEELLRFKKVD